MHTQCIFFNAWCPNAVLAREFMQRRLVFIQPAALDDIARTVVELGERAVQRLPARIPRAKGVSFND